LAAVIAATRGPGTQAKSGVPGVPVVRFVKSLPLSLTVGVLVTPALPEVVATSLMYELC